MRVDAQALGPRWLPRFGLLTAICALMVVVGAASVVSPPLAAACAVAPAAAVAMPWLRGRTAWVAFVLTLCGLMVLGYGFANVPLLPGIPVPLVDVLLVATFLGLAVTGARWPTPQLPFAFAALLFGWASVRVAIDYRTWGSFALRDYTTYVELCALFVGYWLMERIGMDRWIRALSWLSVIVVVYGLMLFHPSVFWTLNVEVGIQRPVALLGHVTGVASVSAFFFFALLRPFGTKSFVLAALAIAPLFLFQSRGLYLAVPLAVLVLALLQARTPGLRRIFAAGALAIVTAGVVLALQPSGRFGSTSPALLREQLTTLVGGAGVGSGSLNARTEWFTQTTDRVIAHPGGLIYGLGLGPDLADGFSADGTILVRKPHDDFLEVFARLGVIGLSIFLVLIGTAVKALFDGSRRSADPRSRLFQQWVLANAVIYLFISATQPLLAYPYGTIPLFGILGAGLALARSSTKGRQ